MNFAYVVHKKSGEWIVSYDPHMNILSGHRFVTKGDAELKLAEIKRNEPDKIPSWDEVGPELLAACEAGQMYLRAALDCDGWDWDSDQRECAEIEYKNISETITKARSIK